MKKLFLLLLFVYSISLNAQTWTNYTVSNTAAPLGNRVVNAVIFDYNGVKWFGTSDGLLSFDGQTWKTYTTADGLVSNNVTSLDYDIELRTLWIGTDKGISQFYHELTWTTWLSGIMVNGIVVDNTGKIWIATNEGIHMYDQYANGEKWNHYTKEANGLPGDLITCITADNSTMNIYNQYDIWFGTSDSGIGKFDGVNCFPYDLTGHGIDTYNKALSIAIEDNGNIWVGTPAGLLLRGDGWFSYSSEGNGPKDNNINTITIDQLNYMVWVGTNGGVSRFNYQTWTDFSTNDVLICNKVNAIALDGQGNTWIGAGLQGNSSGVVSHFDGEVWTNYPLTNSLLCNYTACISVDLDNNKWIGFGYNGFGVTQFDGTNWTNYSMADGLVSNNVICILTDSKGNKWFGTTNGVSKYNGEWFTYGTGNEVFDIAEDHQGRIWFATLNGITVYDGETFISYTNQDGLRDGAIISITVDANGNIWAGSQSGGIAKFNGTLPWTTYIADGVNLEADYVSSIEADDQTNIWIGYATTGFGVTKYDGTNWTHYHQNAGLVDDSVTTIAPDAFDIKWFGTKNGVSKLQGTNWTNYTAIDGMVGNFICDIAIDNEGNKWFATNSGISRLEDRALTFSQSNLNVAYTNNSTASFNIISNINWTLSSNQSWLTLSSSSGSGLGSITVTATLNPGQVSRTATVTVAGSGLSGTITVTQAAATPTGFKEISDCGIILYPIPVIDKLNISVTEPVSKTSITLYNRSGIVIYTSASTEGIKELDMSQYASGIYYIRIVTSDNKISVRKIIKQ